MADISIDPIVASSIMDADEVMESFNGHYRPKSLSMLNGGLENSNRDPSWTIQSDHIRRSALCDGNMIGATGNLDQTSLSASTTETDANAYKEIPGCGIEFYVPYTASVLILTWQIVAARATLYAGSTAVQLRLQYDGAIQSDQVRTIPNNAASLGGNLVRFLHRDRVWSGHIMKNNVAKGWHSASLTIFCNALQARLRIRNMKAVWFK